MLLQKRIFKILASLLLISNIITAQISTNDVRGTNSPFSILGYGDILFDGFVTQKMMGHTGVAMKKENVGNPLNPASYSTIKNTTLDFGLIGESRKNQTQQTVTPSGNFRPSYFQLTFPLGKKGGMALGLSQKYSKLYRISSDYYQVDIDSLRIYNTFNGKSNINNLFLGGAFEIKNLSIGANVSYYFGNSYDMSSFHIFDTTNFSTINVKEKYNTLRNFSFNTGLIYTIKLNKNNQLNVGGTYELGRSLHASLSSFSFRAIHYNPSNTAVKLDTVSTLDDSISVFKLPSKMSVGLSYKYKNNLLINADYLSLDWSNNSGFKTLSTLRTYEKLAFGFQYTPYDGPAKKDMFTLASYSVGFFTGTDYVQANNQDLKFWGLTTGLTLPFKNKLGQVHLGYEYSSRGNISFNEQKDITSVYTLGISFSDKTWFTKRKFN